MKKEQPFVWGKEQDATFVKLKEALANASTLAHFDVNAKTQVIADARASRIAVTLLSATPDSVFR
jgi:GTP cyclohydrolase III